MYTRLHELYTTCTYMYMYMYVHVHVHTCTCTHAFDLDNNNIISIVDEIVHTCTCAHIHVRSTVLSNSVQLIKLLILMFFSGIDNCNVLSAI